MGRPCSHGTTLREERGFSQMAVCFEARAYSCLRKNFSRVSVKFFCKGKRWPPVWPGECPHRQPHGRFCCDRVKRHLFQDACLTTLYSSLSDALPTTTRAMSLPRLRRVSSDDLLSDLGTLSNRGRLTTPCYRCRAFVITPAFLPQLEYEVRGLETQVELGEVTGSKPIGAT